jgi:hypothetical protein
MAVSPMSIAIFFIVPRWKRLRALLLGIQKHHAFSMETTGHFDIAQIKDLSTGKCHADPEEVPTQ